MKKIIRILIFAAISFTAPGCLEIIEEVILALADQKQLLQKIKRLTHRAGIGKRPEVAALAAARTTVESQARKLVIEIGVDVGIALVVAQHHVVARVQCLDQRTFEDQRLGLVSSDCDLDPRDLRDHRHDLDSVSGLTVEITAGALAQIARLANVDDVPTFIEHVVDTRIIGQLAAKGAQTFQALFVVHQHLPSRRAACANTASNIGVVSRRVWVL